MVDVPAGVTVHGAAGEARPQITGAGEITLNVNGAGSERSALRHLEVLVAGGTGVAATNADLTDLIVTGTAQSVRGVELRDGASLASSVVHVGVESSDAIVVSGTTNAAAVRNVTARAEGIGGSALVVDASLSPAAATVKNTILRGDEFDIRVIQRLRPGDRRDDLLELPRRRSEPRGRRLDARRRPDATRRPSTRCSPTPRSTRRRPRRRSTPAAPTSPCR